MRNLPRAELVPQLLKSFAHHRKAEGESWLPKEVYDETLWDVDSLYLYIISDGSIGAPRPKPRVANSSATTACDVCDAGGEGWDWVDPQAARVPDAGLRDEGGRGRVRRPARARWEGWGEGMEGMGAGWGGYGGWGGMGMVRC